MTAVFVIISAVFAVVLQGQGEAFLRRDPDTFGGIAVGDVYDPATQTCCQARAHPRPKRRSYRQCCGNDMFDVTCEVCCDVAVHRRRCGYACCGAEYFNINERLCCMDNHVVSFPPGMQESDLEFIECCGNATVYDSRTQVCSPCDGVSVIDKSHSNTGCCGDATYNADTHLCCDGHTSKRNSDNVTMCCGKNGYDPYTQICCEDHPITVQESTTQYGGCCNQSPFKRYTEGCCGNMVYDVMSLGCCGGKETYNLSSQLCCDGWVVRNKTLPTDTCCGEKVYNHKDYLCCHGALYTTEEGKNESKACCGNSTFNTRNQLCCYKDVDSLAWVVNRTAPSHGRCCGKKSFDPFSQICCSEETSKVMDVSQPFLTYANTVYDVRCCGNVTYSTTEHLCCEGDNDTASITDRSNGYDDCCGGTPYDSRRQMCCGTDIIVRAENTVYYEDTPIDLDEKICCYNYDKRNFITIDLSPPYFRNNTGCCGGHLYRQPEEDCCGDSTVFRSETGICCGDTLVPITANSTMHCCGDQAYNAKTHLCCVGEIKVKNSPAQTSCCYVH